MKMILKLLRLEFRRFSRRPSTYLAIIIMPLLLITLGSLFFKSLGTQNLKIGVYSKDRSPLSKFTVGVVMSLFQGGTVSYVGKDFEEKLMSGEYHAVIVIPEDFTSSLFSAKRTKLYYVPSPVDTHLSAAAFLVFKKLFDDLGGGPFFNPQVLRQMYVSKSVPAPELVTEKGLDFSQVFAPALIFLTIMFTGIIVGCGGIVRDREENLATHYALANLSPLKVVLLKLIPTFVLATVVGLASFGLFVASGLKIKTSVLVLLVLNSAIFYSTLGLLISTFSKSSLTAYLIGSTLSFLFLLSSGALTPISSLPLALRKTVKLMPTTTAVYLTRVMQFFGEYVVSDLLKVNSAFTWTLSVIMVLVIILRLRLEQAPSKMMR